jgi:hypothetical protein
VEFALVLPIFALVLFGLFDVGKLVYANSVLSQAAREGARLGAAEAAWITVPASGCVNSEAAIGSTNPGAHVCPASIADFKSHVIDAVHRMTVGLGAISAVHVSCNDGTGLDPVPVGQWTESAGGNGCHDGAGNPTGTIGELVSVRVEYTYLPFTPIINTFLGSVPLSGSATMVIQ